MTWPPAALTIDPNAEDIHTFVEQTLTARIGDAGKRLHTGRSRNDQVALDIRLYSAGRQPHPARLTSWSWSRSCCREGRRAHRPPSCPATPTCSAPSPSPSATHLMAYAWMLLRDLQRFEDATARMDAQCPLGSGALAGTTYPLDRQFDRREAGLCGTLPQQP